MELQKPDINKENVSVAANMMDSDSPKVLSLEGLKTFFSLKIAINFFIIII